MTRPLVLALEDPTPGCDNPGSCVFDDVDHDGPCATECGECDGRGLGCTSCHDGLIWTLS
jgi:hypothetical protein